MSPPEHRRRSGDRRTGDDRRAVVYRKAAPGPTADAALGRLFPSVAQLADESDAGPAAAIAAHRRELSARLGREVGLLVAGLDYLVNISHDLVAPTIVEQEVLAMLERRSVTDPLTGLFNRYHFEATLQHEVARSARHAGQVALVLMDVDQLKAVNDRWGHYAGDRVLGRVAGTLRGSARASDIACRFGGDEFALILPDTDAPGARRAAERICSNVGASAPSAGAEAEVSTRITVSGGVAVWPLTARRITETELIVAADQALYLAKRRGGNCIVAAAPAPETGPAGAEGEAIR